MYIHVYMHVHIKGCAYTYTHICRETCICTYTCIYILYRGQAWSGIEKCMITRKNNTCCRDASSNGVVLAWRNSLNVEHVQGSDLAYADIP